MCVCAGEIACYLAKGNGDNSLLDAWLGLHSLFHSCSHPHALMHTEETLTALLATIRNEPFSMGAFLSMHCTSYAHTQNDRSMFGAGARTCDAVLLCNGMQTYTRALTHTYNTRTRTEASDWPPGRAFRSVSASSQRKSLRGVFVYVCIRVCACVSRARAAGGRQGRRRRREERNGLRSNLQTHMQHT